MKGMNFILRIHMHMRGVSEFMESSPEIMKWGFDFVLIKTHFMLHYFEFCTFYFIQFNLYFDPTRYNSTDTSPSLKYGLNLLSLKYIYNL